MEWFKIKSEKDHDLLVVNNFIHRVDRIRDKTEYYKCIQNCYEQNHAILKNLKNKTDVILSKPHYHPTHGVKLANRGFRNKLKEELTQNPTKPVPKTFNEIRRSVITSGIEGATNSEVIDAIPVFTSIKSSGYRKKMKMIPPLPSKLSDLTIER
ncbi:uncharacterized protein LOC115034846 [Acyrthosiphon pisum]|uniref:Uncharacterized protein n=1 Tax=Acyrthosiphon pisum TaxID=7029 RepID=A0A8R2JV38_ACYPI|nr:uncharacterized protein LOC115034846 [Acyrthosiphon pisum]